MVAGYMCSQGDACTIGLDTAVYLTVGVQFMYLHVDVGRSCVIPPGRYYRYEAEGGTLAVTRYGYPVVVSFL